MSTCSDTRPISLEQALTVLSSHGYRLTVPRRATVDALLRLERPFTAEQLVGEAPGIGRATVYRTLEIMTSVDILTRLLNDDGHPTYVVGTPGHRHHLICRSCGAVITFTDCPIDDLLQTLQKRTGFIIEGHHLEVIGTCPNCQKSPV